MLLYRGHMRRIAVALVLITLFFVSGCGQKQTYYKNSNQTRNFDQDVAYCKSVAIGSIQRPNMQQYQNNASVYAPVSGTMRDQYGNAYYYQENYNPMAAAQSNMNMAQQGFNNAAVSMQNLAAQLEAEGARTTVFNQCMAQFGWTQISKEENDRLQQLRANPYQAVIHAAEQGNANAQVYLAGMYSRGDGVQQNSAQAVKWMRKAAEQGDPNGQHYLGEMYAGGYGGLVKDESNALEWFRKAAAQRHPIALCIIGDAYFNGLGVSKDRAQAIEWYSKAVPGLSGSAQNGMPEAQFKLAYLLFNGFGVAKDEAQAVMWLKKAAEQGYQPAQDELSKMKQAGYL